MANERVLEHAETIDTGFIIDGEGVQHPGRVARCPDGRLCVVRLARTTNEPESGFFNVQDGALWLFSGEHDQYALFGVRGGLGNVISRGDFQDGYETFVRNRLDVDAVFRVSGHPRLLCEERKSRAHSPPPTIHMGFDALGVVFDNHGLWIGLEPSATGEYPPPRPYRTKHATTA